MQRTGRKGHAMFRMVVQDSRLTPTSGKVVARLGSYDPHAKAIILDKDKAAFYLEHGAQPSDRVARLLKAEGVKLPDWVKLAADKERTIRNADKRRSTRPAEPVAAEETPAAETEISEAPVEEPETKTTEQPAETPEPTTEPVATTEETETPAAEEAADAEEAPAEEPATETAAAQEESATADTAETPEETSADEPEPASDEAESEDK
ncbi:MAG TPA: 30S ribosomal protein S16 [Verrucomicrobiae bacterium]|nr:30S ribosomal protein S16 [Verrucomicrobiae bacterium]